MQVLPRAFLRRGVPIGLVAAIVLAGGLVARADTRGDLQAARDRLTSLREEIEGQRAALGSLQTDLNTLARDIEVGESALEATHAEVDATRTQISQAQSRLDAARDELGAYAREAYIDGIATEFNLYLGASSMSDLSDRMQFADVLAQHQADLGTKIQTQIGELTIEREQLSTLLARQAAQVEQLHDRRSELQARFAEQQAQLQRLSSLESQAGALIARLEKTLKQELAAPVVVPSFGGGGGGDGDPGPLYTCPVRGPHAFADTYGIIHVHPGWTHPHLGNDIISPYGTPVVAPFDGTASSASDDNAGLYVTVSGSQGSVLMMHLARFGSLGSVQTGDVVGYVGDSGNASGPHVHFEWHPGGSGPVDPFPHLSEVC